MLLCKDQNDPAHVEYAKLLRAADRTNKRDGPGSKYNDKDQPVTAADGTYTKQPQGTGSPNSSRPQSPEGAAAANTAAAAGAAGAGPGAGGGTEAAAAPNTAPQAAAPPGKDEYVARYAAPCCVLVRRGMWCVVATT